MSPKYFYDAMGSALFEQICETPEYYPTRTELKLLGNIAHTLTKALPEDTVLVELGSGASEKTRALLDATTHISTYVPIDISPDALCQARRRLKTRYPALRIDPLVADFTTGIHLPDDLKRKHRVGFFPGSTIGNFDRPQAILLLQLMLWDLGRSSELIIGVDLLKDRKTLIAAYNDAQGITARFNKNLLVRMNLELDGGIDLDAFEHRAIWNEAMSRIEMHLVSLHDQTFSVAGHAFFMRKGESIHTENSHKFTVESFSNLAVESGWTVADVWVDEHRPFGIFRLTASAGEEERAT
ncbi:L-histidine N(alpha)-methyltransferase [Dyella aluminiiresistens]|uniref:L-histidine N(alpha)-methyltransferase n=1 Tax=Dyella aluminiiresistens TaxID=3069105 RepID=UPI00399D37E1